MNGFLFDLHQRNLPGTHTVRTLTTVKGDDIFKKDCYKSVSKFIVDISFRTPFTLFDSTKLSICLCAVAGFSPTRKAYESLRHTLARNITKPARHGAGKRNRTPDLLITNQLLYRLSYASILKGSVSLSLPIRQPLKLAPYAPLTHKHSLYVSTNRYSVGQSMCRIRVARKYSPTLYYGASP